MIRPDFSNYVAHFTKDAAPIGAVDNPDDVIVKKIAGTASERLVSILTQRRILATPMPWTNKKAVCFTECPFWSLLAHANQYSPFGVGFTKPHLFAAKGGPAIYLRPDLYEKQQEFKHEERDHWRGLHPELFAFVTPFVPDYAPEDVKGKWAKPTVDYTHEREWRVPHDFSFTLDQVQFVTVSTYADMANFPLALTDAIGHKKFVIMEMYREIERLWPTHRVE